MVTQLVQTRLNTSLALFVRDAAHPHAIIAHMFVLLTVSLVIDLELVGCVLVVTAVAPNDVNGQIQSVVVALIVDARVRVTLIAMGQRRRSLHSFVDLLGRLRVVERFLAR